MTSPLKDLIRNPTPAELELVAYYGGLRPDPARERLFRAFAQTGLPHRRVEGWRWSDFRAGVQQLDTPAGLPAPDPLLRPDCLHLTFGRAGLSVPAQLPPGLRLLPAEDVQAAAGAEDFPLGALAAALSGGEGRASTVRIEVSGDTPVRIHMAFSGPVSGPASLLAARLVVLVRAGARLEVSESHLGGARLSSSLLEYSLEPGASLQRVVCQRAGVSETQAVTACIDLDERAELKQTVLAFGAGTCRIETRILHRGAASDAMLNAAYLAGRGYHVDLTSHVRHGAPGCVTRQLTRGAVMNGGKGIFQGKFHVPRHAGQMTDASMQHNALLLEEGAEVFAKPELEILADDVQCAHGNTCGELDAAQLFYLRQRGIPLEAARALLTSAFLATALAGAGEFEALLRSEADQWLSM